MTPSTKRPGPNFHIVNSNGSDSSGLALLFSYKVVNSCKCAVPRKLLLYHQPLTKIGQGYKSLRSYISVVLVGSNLLLLFRKIRFLAIMVKPLISIIISSQNPFLHTVYAPGIRHIILNTYSRCTKNICTCLHFIEHKNTTKSRATLQTVFQLICRRHFALSFYFTRIVRRLILTVLLRFYGPLCQHSTLSTLQHHRWTPDI